MRTGGANQTLRRAALAAVAIALVVGGDAPVADAAQPYPADFFGISAGADLAQLPAAVLNREMDLMQQAGVHWVRAAVPWAQVQRVEKDPDQWESIDRVVDAAASRHMQVLGIVDNPPEWAKQNIPRIPCKVQPPFDLTAYATFTGALARRYPASVLSAIELENSPNLGGLWKHPDPCAYAQLMKQSYPAIKSANSAIKVLNGGLGGTKNDGTHVPGDVFFAQLYKYGAKGNFDIASFHPYSYPCFPSKSCPQERPWYRIDAVRNAMVANGDGAKPIWASEYGAPTNGTSSDGHVSEATQAQMMLDAIAEWHKLPYAGPFFFFELADNGTNPKVKSDWFGLVSHDLSHLKPAYTAYRKLATGKGAPT